MKIGILTFHAAINYGAVLQAYALVTYLKQLGHEPEIIDYRPTPVLAGEFAPRYKIFGLHPADFINRTKQRHFRHFRTKYMPETASVYRTVEELVNAPEYDAYICGSDQIWNPVLINGKIDPVYFLSFVGRSKRKIAYAASSGGKEFEEQDLGRVGTLLKEIDCISVREKSLVDPVAALSGKNIVQVLDPTLLPVDYSALITKRPDEYILLYPLQTAPSIYEKAVLLAKRTGLPILNLGTKVNPRKHPGRLMNGSPQDFISLFHGARYVVTNSFHGTVFSTIFNRPFLSCGLEGAFSVRNVRMIDYLGALDLTDFFYDASVRLPLNILEQIDSIQWNEVNRRKAILQKSSVKFIKDSLG
ncbi:polysaccharide pyruvyl transferase family protein [Pontiellaceae bacterium B1224]|nr:polysaccharide pyruvyl transferase family protein [Pontiellaceae bacterium B1224]